MVEGLTSAQTAFLRNNKQENMTANKQENKKTSLETFTVRIPSTVASGVRRVVMKRKLAGEEDLTQQALVRDVLTEWLKTEEQREGLAGR
jgi:hypothetical protein